MTNKKQSDHNYQNEVEIPTDISDEQAMREYGRQLAIDILIRDAVQSDNPQKIVPITRSRKTLPFVLWSAAAAVCVIGFNVISNLKIPNNDTPKIVSLDPSWKILAGMDADYRIINTNHIKLLHGELRLASSKPSHLTVETPNAVATAKSTEFLIGHHSESDQSNNDESNQPNNNNNNNMKLPEITRMLVRTGIVTLATTHGTVTAHQNEAAIAKPDKAPEKIAVKTNSSFAFQSYAQLAKEHEGQNLFFSPYSISNALLMVAEGARGETAQEMGKVLGFPEGLRHVGNDAQQIPWEMSVIRAGQSGLNSKFNRGAEQNEKNAVLRKDLAELKQRKNEMRKRAEKRHEEGKPFTPEARKALIEEFRSIEKKVNALHKELDSDSLRIANAVWGDIQSSFKPAWTKTVEQAYGAGAVQPARFSTEPEKERQRINAWVASQTNDRIQDLFGPGTITTETNLVLANAIYFKGSWLNPFPKRRTKPAGFLLPNGETRQAQIMGKTSKKGIRYAAFNGDGSYFRSPRIIPRNGSKLKTYPDKNGFSIVEMPYRGNGMSMVAIAPNNPAGLPALEAQLTAGNVSRWIASLGSRETEVIMPKFEMKTQYTLNQTLEAMGMPSAFSTRAADFSGISSEPDYIDLVAHQAFIKVDEEGTEAAAATGASKSAPSRDIPFIPVFKANRPFIYLIRDTKSGTILFLGRVMNPNE